MTKTKADLEQEIIERDNKIKELKERLDVLYKNKQAREEQALLVARRYSKHIELESAKVSCFNSIAVSLNEIKVLLYKVARSSNKRKKK